MSDILIERWDFDEQVMKDFSASEEKIQSFIQWLLNTSLWKEYPETLLLDKCLRLRKELIEELKPAVNPLKDRGIKKGSNGRFVKRDG